MVTSVDVGGRMGSIDITPDGTRLFVPLSRFDSNQVAVVDTASYVLAYVTVGFEPIAAGVAPDGATVFVSNFYGSVSIIHTASKMVVATIPVPVPEKASFEPYGTLAYVPSGTSPGSALVIDTASYNVVTSIAVGDSPITIAITPDGSYGYVANYFSSSVSVIDLSNNTVIDTVSLASYPIWTSLTPDGTQAYVGYNFIDGVTVIDTSDDTVIADVPVGGRPTSVDFLPDSSRAYVTNNLGNGLAVIDVATSTLLTTVATGQYSYHVVVKP